MHVAVDWAVARSWSQVLADRDDVDAHGAQVGEGAKHLGLGLAHADDEPGLDAPFGTQPFGASQQGQRRP